MMVGKDWRLVKPTLIKTAKAQRLWAWVARRQTGRRPSSSILS